MSEPTLPSPKSPKFPHPADLVDSTDSVVLDIASESDDIVAELEKLELELKQKESYLVRLINRQQQLDESNNLNSTKNYAKSKSKSYSSSRDTSEVREIGAADSVIPLLVTREILRSDFDTYFLREMQKWDDSLASAGFGITNSAGSNSSSSIDASIEDAKNEKRALFFDEMERHICAGLRDLRKTFVYDCCW